MARFLTYARLSLGFVACAWLVLFFISHFLDQLFWTERLKLIVMMITPFVLIGWSWINSWRSSADQTARAFGLLKRALIGHMIVGLAAFVVGTLGFSVFLALVSSELVPNSGNWITDLGLSLERFGFFALLTDIVILLFAPNIRADASVILFYRRGVGITSGVLLLSIIAWALATIPLATKSAEAVAGEEPYCILVARGTDYKTAEGLFDLNGLNMQALYDDMGSYFNYHAILMIGTDGSRRVFNWSHRRQGFEFLQERYYNSPHTARRIPFCEPQPNFVRALPWFKPKQGQGDY